MAEGMIAASGGGKITVTGLESENVREGVNVVVKQGSRVAASVGGTLVPAWATTVALPPKYKGKTLVVDCTGCPGWWLKSKEDFVVGWIRGGIYFNYKQDAPEFGVLVSNYNSADGRLTVSLTSNYPESFNRWLDGALIVATNGSGGGSTTPPKWNGGEY